MKQQQLTFEKGITNVPSDPICSDNTLQDAVGMIFDKGEHRVIQSPVTKYALGVDTALIKFVHKFNNEERIIRAYTYNNSLEWYIEGGIPETLMTWVGEDVNITAIGKTLIISDDNGLHYFLWKGDDYEDLGSEIPTPNVEFQLGDYYSTYFETTRTCSGIIYQASNDWYYLVDGQSSNWNNAVLGMFYELRNQIWEKGCFHSSFCVRAALELFDGTFYKITQPVFMLNQFAMYGVADITGAECSVKMYQWGQELYYKCNTDYSDWSDLVKNVVLFVTPEHSLFDTGATVQPLEHLSAETPICYFINSNSIDYNHIFINGKYRVLKGNPDTDMKTTIENGTYYKLCGIGVNSMDSFAKASAVIDTNRLKNLASQQSLTEDDYFSQSKLTAEYIYAYNARLNLANVSRCFFEGYGYFMPFNSSSSSFYLFCVDIETNEGLIKVVHKTETAQKQGIYFYYPDARAKYVTIYKSSTDFTINDTTAIIPNGSSILLESARLTEHPSLNGAYFFGGVSSSMDEPSVGTISEDTTINIDNSKKERLPNYIITSPANNPFTFTAKGYFTVGVESIVGVSTITQALSQGQFGQYPLIIFATDGIWSASLDSEGYFSAVHPMSREVCSNNKSITQTDSAIFFISEKGLMIVSGSDVQCVSDALSGNVEPLTFFAGCVIAYDYRNALLWLLNKDYNFAYTYSLKSGTFSKFSLQYSWSSLPNPSFEGFLPEDTSVEDCTVTEFVEDHGLSDYELSVLFDKETQLFCTQIDYIESGVEQTAYVSGVDSSYNVGANVLYDKDGKTFFKWNADNELIEVTPCFGTFKGVVNNYPDTYIQIGKKVLSLLEKPQRDEDEIIYPATFTTRPLKLENALALKSIMQMKHISLLNDDATMSVTIEASNNLKDWATITSLRSTPWKYYRFTYNLENLKATDTFSGTVLLTEERRTNKLR